MDLNIAEEFNTDIEKVIQSQVDENREAIFFIYEDLTTSDIYKGEATHIDLSKEEEAQIMSQGEIIGSVHTHPSGFDLSTIDVMTGIATTQKYMSVATPIFQQDIEEDYVLTTLDLSEMSFNQRFRLMRAMRRSTAGITEIGRNIRKEINLQRFDLKGYRSHEIEVDGVKLPVYQRPSFFDIEIGDKTRVKQVDGTYEYIE
jgi:proteasome lid subunit RPN8/RPN11